MEAGSRNLQKCLMIKHGRQIQCWFESGIILLLIRIHFKLVADKFTVEYPIGAEILLFGTIVGCLDLLGSCLD